MGRLFWKFFVIVWLAQAVTALGVGTALWMLREPGPPLHERMPPRDALGNRPPGLDNPAAPPVPLPPPRDARAGAPPDLPPDRRGAEREFRLGGRPPPWPPLILLAAGGVVSLLFAGGMAWYFSRPIHQLRAAFARLSEGDMRSRVRGRMGHRDDELADLGDDFDAMAERLQGLVEGQRRLLHDVSHEMRSPLARLQAAGDLLEQQPARSAELVQRMRGECTRIDRLVDELLTLSRLEDTATSEAMEPVDIAMLVDEAVADAAMEAEAKGIVIAVDVPPQLSVDGRRHLLARALDNVLRNAVRYVQAGGQVRLAASRQDDGVAIEVADNGPGVSDTELDAIFEPFRRGRGALGTDGHGLGLAIARRIMQRHGGTAVARAAQPHGLIVTLTMGVRHAS